MTKLKMEDIARLANVSRSAVSLALNGKPGVSQETREKIFKIMEEHHYSPLRKRNHGKSHKLINVNFVIIRKSEGVVTSNIRALPFFDNLLSQVLKNVNSFGGKVQVETIEANELEDSLERLVKESATIVLGTDLTEKEVVLINSKLRKSVFIDTYYPGVSADFVTMDNFQGAYLAAKTLLNKGYRKIGYVASKTTMSNFNERRRGFNLALKEEGIEVDYKHFYRISPTRMRPDLEDNILCTENLPEALFCENDYIAIRLIKEFTQKGIKIPNDVAIIGFDDIYEGRMIIPELTTIHVPVEQIVDQALHQLQCKVSWENWEPQKCIVSTKLIERESI
ncbi:LacI family DNA-binding transcriptional regulator [Ligilactobacillus agilis]|uniref:LacI family DNA-binding transcriptional regulator n=1 Tax=Ligilactobacillus agilis TaxID=1601 RepID=UPI003F88976E